MCIIIIIIIIVALHQIWFFFQIWPGPDLAGFGIVNPARFQAEHCWAVYDTGE